MDPLLESCQSLLEVRAEPIEEVGIDADAGDLHPGQDRYQRQFDLLIEGGSPSRFELATHRFHQHLGGDGAPGGHSKIRALRALEVKCTLRLLALGFHAVDDDRELFLGEVGQIGGAQGRVDHIGSKGSVEDDRWRVNSHLGERPDQRLDVVTDQPGSIGHQVVEIF